MREWRLDRRSGRPCLLWRTRRSRPCRRGLTRWGRTTGEFSACGHRSGLGLGSFHRRKWRPTRLGGRVGLGSEPGLGDRLLGLKRTRHGSPLRNEREREMELKKKGERAREREWVWVWMWMGLEVYIKGGESEVETFVNYQIMFYLTMDGEYWVHFVNRREPEPEDL